MSRVMPQNKGKKFSRVGAHANIVRFLGAMVDGAHSLRALCDKTGIHYETLRPLINLLHEQGVVHISAWKLDSMGRQSIAVYQLGVGVDVPKRKPKTGSQRSLAYKYRKQAGEEDKLFKSVNTPLVRNAGLDQALRGWGATA